MNSKRDIREIRAAVRKAAEKRWGAGWLRELAREAGWKERRLRTFLHRGKTEPPGDDLSRLERAAGLRTAMASGIREPVEPYMLQEVREVRCFTSLVEALRKIDRDDGATYRAAWRVVMASAEALRALAGWTDEDWQGTIVKDHWRTLTKEPEERTIRRALDDQLNQGKR